MKTKTTEIKSFKGFDKNMKCRGFQFKEGKTYKEEKAIACQIGFHACENPIDCFSYYTPSDSVYHEVLQKYKISKNSDDSKVASTEIKIGAKIDIKGLIKATLEYVKSKCTNENIGADFSALVGGNSSALTGGYSSALTGGYSSALTGGDRSALTGGDSSALTGGDRSALTGGNSSALTGGNRSALVGGDSSALTGGDSSALTGGYSSALVGGNRSALTGGDSSALTGGNRSALTGGDSSALVGGNRSALVGGDSSVIYGCGIDAKVRAGLHSVLALAVFDGNYNIVKVIAKVVDGKQILADTWYILVDGKFTKTE